MFIQVDLVYPPATRIVVNSRHILGVLPDSENNAVLMLDGDYYEQTPMYTVNEYDFIVRQLGIYPTQYN
jgi:hypothetical protein